MTEKDLGEMGEGRFYIWCAEVGLTANKSHKDNKGWDYFVEFPFVSDSNISADRQLSPIKCQIQIKSTDTTERKKASVRNIVLSNLRYLTSVLMPAFIIFIEFKGESEPNQAFLVHIDEKLIGKILKRLRQEDNKGKSDKLNKMTLAINYDESHELPSLNGKGLKQAIEKYVGDMDSYVEKKQAVIKTVGFDEHPFQGKFFLDKKELPKLIEASLGLDRTIELNNFQSSQIRFGIEQPLSKKQEGKAYLSINKPPTYLGVVRFKTDKFSAGVCFDAEMYIAPHFHMPKESIFFRVKGDFFEIKFIDYSNKKFGKSEKTLSWFFNVEMNVNKLKKAVALLNAIKKNNFVIMEFEKFGDLPSCLLECLTQISDIDSFLDDATEIVENAYYLTQYFELEQELSFSLVYLIENQYVINTLSKILTADFKQKEVIINSKDIFEVSKNTAFIQFFHISLGDYVIGVILGLSGILENFEEGKYKFIVSQSNSKKIVILKERLSSIKNDFEIEVENFILDNYENENIQVIHNFNFENS